MLEVYFIKLKFMLVFVYNILIIIIIFLMNVGLTASNITDIFVNISEEARILKSKFNEKGLITVSAHVIVNITALIKTKGAFIFLYNTKKLAFTSPSLPSIDG